MEAHEGSLQGWWAHGRGEPLAQAPADVWGCKAPHPGYSWQFALPLPVVPELCPVPSLPQGSCVLEGTGTPSAQAVPGQPLV